MAEQKGSKYSPKTGVVRCTVVAINPTLEQANALRGTTWDKPTEYLGKDKEDNERVLIEIWLKDTQSGTLFQEKYYMSKLLRTSKNNPKNKQWTNSLLQVSWAESLDALKEKQWWDDSREAHQMIVGEEGLVEFLNSWILQGRRPNEKYPLTDVNIVLDFKKLFSGDFSELQAMVGKYNEPVTALATINNYNGKAKQSVYSKILPGTDYYWDKVLNKDTAGAVGGWFEDIQGTYGCRDEYSLELMNGGSAHSFTVPAAKNTKSTISTTDESFWLPF